MGWLVWARVLWKRYYWPGFSREMEPIGYTCVYHYKQMCMYILYIQIHRCREKVWGGRGKGKGTEIDLSCRWGSGHYGS